MFGLNFLKIEKKVFVTDKFVRIYKFVPMVAKLQDIRRQYLFSVNWICRHGGDAFHKSMLVV